MWATTLQSFDTFISHWLHEFCTRHRQKWQLDNLTKTWPNSLFSFRNLYFLKLACNVTISTFNHHSYIYTIYNQRKHRSHALSTIWIPVKGFQIEISLKSFLQLSVFLIILTPDWHIISCSKGSGCKNRKWRFPTCREGVTICGKPHLLLVFLSLLLKPLRFHRRLGSLENKP